MSQILTKVLDHTPAFLKQRTVWLVSTFLTIFNTASLFYIVYQNRSSLVAFHWQIEWRFVAISFFFYSVNLLIVVFGWFQLVRHFHVEGTFRTHFEIFVLNELSKRVPGKFWYVAGRIMMYQQVGIRKTEVAVASGLETVFMMNGALMGYLLSAPFAHKGEHIALSLIALCLISFLFIHPDFINWLLRRMKRRQIMEQLPVVQLLKWLLLYGSGWLCGGTMLYWWLRALDPVASIPLANIILIWALTGIVSNLMWFLPGTFGV